MMRQETKMLNGDDFSGASFCHNMLDGLRESLHREGASRLLEAFSHDRCLA